MQFDHSRLARPELCDLQCNQKSSHQEHICTMGTRYESMAANTYCGSRIPFVDCLCRRLLRLLPRRTSQSRESWRLLHNDLAILLHFHRCDVGCIRCNNSKCQRQRRRKRYVGLGLQRWHPTWTIQRGRRLWPRLSYASKFTAALHSPCPPYNSTNNCPNQDWILICVIIEIVVDVITITIYAIIFYRFYSKRKLRKSMDVRDKARSDLYLAHLRSQSAPNTPGYPLSPRSGKFPGSPRINEDPYSNAENGDGYKTQYATVSTPAVAVTAGPQRPFQLQAPPMRSPDSQRDPSDSRTSSPDGAGSGRGNAHFNAAPGERSYESVPIPASYGSPVTSPTFMPRQSHSRQNTPPVGMAMSEHHDHQRN